MSRHLFVRESACPCSPTPGHEKGTKSAEGAVAGGGTGAVIGGALGWLAGIGMLAIPGAGPFIAAGPIVATLAGMGADGVAARHG
jgi:hypothetical protein